MGKQVCKSYIMRLRSNVQLKNWKTLAIFLLFSSLGFSLESNLRVGGMLGLGKFNVSVQEIQKSEEPYSLSFFMDYSYSARMAIGVEHFRSATLAPINSRVGMSGVSFKYYFLNPHPQILDEAKEIKKSFLIQKNYTPYYGFGIGYGQSSLFKRTETDVDASTTGAYGTLRLGIERPWVSTWGLRSELNFGQTLMGSGTVSFYQLVVGMYCFL